MWISTEIHYTPCKVYKKTWYGKSVKNGYQLTQSLYYRYKDNAIFALPIGYVFDGPSYPKFLEKLVGERDAEACIAASAMHDTMNNMPIMYSSLNEIKYTKFKIKKGAKLYRKMIKQWPNKEDKPNSFKRRIQYIGLILFQRLYSVMSSEENWKKYT
jgi:hypothetical protein